MNYRKWYSRQTCILLMLLIILMASCASNTKKENEITQVQEKKSDRTGEMYLDSDIYRISLDLREKYLKEGFMTPAKFRVVILTVRDANIPRDEIEEKAKKRAFISLQKHITSEGKQNTKNLKAELLNLISLQGKLSKQMIEECADDVYYYDIDKENLKRHIMSLSDQ